MAKPLVRESIQSSWIDRSLRTRENILAEKAENGDLEKAEQGCQKSKKQSESVGFSVPSVAVVGLAGHVRHRLAGARAGYRARFSHRLAMPLYWEKAPSHWFQFRVLSVQKRGI
jgi:hypothetical protein